jgi:hypothetical protein
MSMLAAVALATARTRQWRVRFTPMGTRLGLQSAGLRRAISFCLCTIIALRTGPACSAQNKKVHVVGGRAVV